jgi:DNA-binding CsgD family transcriptional regulator
MTRTTGPGGDGNRPQAMLPELAEKVLRPELPSLAEEIILAIRDKIPEYARPMDGPYGQIMRTGVEQALTSFVDRVADPSTSLVHRDEVALMLGRHEAEEGRSLDSLQTAYRVGSRVAWHRIMEVGRRTPDLTSDVMSMLADAVFEYMNELAELSFQGYREARAVTAEEQQVVRRRLLQLILDRDQPIPLRALADIAADANWPLPEQVTAVAVQPSADGEAGPLAAESDVLASLDEGQPHMLIPGETGVGREAALVTRLGTRRAAIGLAVPLADAADSLRWARQALALAESGAIDAGQIVHCEDHLLTLWLMSDGALAEQISRRQLGALEGLTPRQRERLTETFGAWLETRGTAAEIADRLQVHPQTVRYRIRQLERTLGDQFGDPDTRFAMEMVLRAMRLRDRAARQQAATAASGTAGPLTSGSGA